MTELIIFVVVVLCNIVGFYHGANKLWHNRFCERIFDSLLFFILGATIGIAGTIIGWIYSKIKRVVSKKEAKNNRDDFYIAEYGAKEEELGEKIRRSPNVQKIADAILERVDKGNLPESISVNNDYVYLSIKNGKSFSINFEDIGIAPIPSGHNGTLARVLAEKPSINKYYEFDHKIGYNGGLYLRREYRLEGLNKWQ